MDYKLDFDPARKGVMVGKLQDGRLLCVTTEHYIEALGQMEMSWLDVPEHWLGYEEPGKVWLEDAPKPVQIKAGDWVTCQGSALVGFVKRVARNGSWVDVDWHTHSKRMKPEHLQVRTTIDLAAEWTVTDETRAKEVAQQA